MTYVENDVARLIAPDASVTEGDSADFDTGTLTVTISVNDSVDDRLTILHTGTAPGEIGVAGNAVTYGGVEIGTFAGGTDGATPLVITFGPAATPLAVEALTRAIAYSNVSEAPATEPRTLTFVVTDGDGDTSGAIEATIAVTGVNDAPTIAGFEASATYNEGGGALALDLGGNATLTDVDRYGYEMTRVGTGFAQPIATVGLPDGRVLVCQRNGEIMILDPATGTTDPTPFLDISDDILIGVESSFMSLALAPDFATSGQFYVSFTNLDGNNEIRRYAVQGDNPDQADMSSAHTVMVISHPDSDIHNGGMLLFGPDGYFYITTGDGNAAVTGPGNPQDPNHIAGKILRIDVTGDDFPEDPLRNYAIPEDNPYATGGGLPEVFASGLRNPFKASFDPATGILYIADVGETRIEEIDILRPGDGGANFGWMDMEGTLPYQGTDSPDFTAPVAQYGHGSGPLAGNSITGGVVYRGPIESLVGKYFFADFISNNIWSLDADAMTIGSTLTAESFLRHNAAFWPDQGSIGGPTSIATDAEGNLYFVSLFNGGVYRLAPSATPNFAGGSITVAITDNLVAGEDLLGLNLSPSSGVTLGNGLNFGSLVSVGGIVIGTVGQNGNGANGQPLFIEFNGRATTARIDQLIHALTYNNSAGEPTEGERELTITVRDGAGTANGGADSLVFTTRVDVVATNDAPVNIVGGAVAATEDLAVSLTGMSVSDAEADPAADDISVTLSVDGGGTLAIRTDIVGGITAANIVGGANGSGTITILATQDEINATLAAATGLVFTPAEDFFGSVELTVLTSDLGLGGAGGPRETSTSRTIEVAGVNDAPTESANAPLTLAEGATGTIGAALLAYADIEQDASALTYTVTSTQNGALRLDGVALEIGDSFTQADIDAARVTFVHDGSETLTAQFGFDLSDGDGGLIDGQTFALTITPVDDPAIAGADTGTTDEANAATIDALDNDEDVDGPALSIVQINGEAAVVGTPVTLPSGARLTLNANGTFSYDPNHVYDQLPGAGSGAVNLQATDSFTYTLADGGTATVVVTINGLDAGNNVLLGTEGPDALIGAAGNDTFLAFGGGDSMTGGGGDDIFRVDSGGDVVNEAEGEGFDTVYASSSFAIGADSEVEIISVDDHNATTAIDFIGNRFTRYLYGNNGANILFGGAGAEVMLGFGGDDTFYVDNFDDYVGENAGGGFDTIYASTSYDLAAGSEVEILSVNDHNATTAINFNGNGFANYLYGNDGANTLNGVGGADVMLGFGGDDIFYVDQSNDYVFEGAGGGFDIIYSSASFTLDPESEIEILSVNDHGATTAISFTGNRFANNIYGNNGANVLNGGAGADALLGLGGADTFAFTTALGNGNVDYIIDFASLTDRIALDHNVFAGLGLGALSAAAFATGAAAHDASDRIIYNNLTGELFFDPDGTGAAAAIPFATLNGAPPLIAADLVVI